MKRGQISFFVIIGIIILAVISLGLYFRSNLLDLTPETEQILPVEVENFKDNFENCIDQINQESLITIGIQGGYSNLPEKILILENITVPYYCYEEENLALSLEEVKNNLKNELNFFLPLCIEREIYPNLDIKEEISEINIDLEETTKIKIHYPMTITKDENSIKLENKLNYEYDLNLKDIIELSENIATQRINSPENFDLVYLTDLGYEIEINPITENEELYTLIDIDSIINEEPYLFAFGCKL